ncbi:MAG: hypothetical protein ABIY47_14650, partial [Opitutaceae bacterium]
LTWQRFRRLGSAQMRFHGWGLLLLPVSLVLTVPFGWAFAFFQNVSVLGDGDDAFEAAREQAVLWPAQNHLGLLILSALALCAWANLAAAFWAVPWLANRLLGIENLFGLSGGWFFNTTFLASVTMLTWLAVDPLVKGFYTLRIFHGRARRTGEDLRVELRSARARKGALHRAALAALLLVATLGIDPLLPAADTTAPLPPAAVKTAELDQAIERTLAGSDFQWRLRPAPAPKVAEESGFVASFLRQGREILKAVGRGVRNFIDWLWDLFPSDRGSSSRSKPAGILAFGGNVVLIAIIVAATVFVLVLLAHALVWRRSRQGDTAVLQARAATVATPDLQDENTQAAQLPVDGWLALAREQMALGEWRLALRALYLATLAQLAAEGLLSLTRFKTNLDYERELKRRALARPEIVTRFSQRRCGFEAAWYGRALAQESDARSWLAEMHPPLRS